MSNTFVQGHPVKVLGRTTDRTWVETLDGKLIKTHMIGGYVSYSTKGWVDSVELSEEDSCGCMGDNTCPACRAAATTGLAPDGLPY